MRFSFIVPIYKKPVDTVRKSLKSLFDMSHKDIEVICVFDGADEELEKVASEFDVKKLVIEHGGAPKARNAGAKLATGDFLSFWDCDCIAEPEMASMWELNLKDRPDCDFCYSGYAWTNPNVPGFPSEPFDPYALKHYNYIASMFPIAKDRFPGWDESLTGLQDWDYWRRITEAGCKGVFIEGFGFITDLPDPTSISGQTDKNKERIKAVKEKHGDRDNSIVVFNMGWQRDSLFASKVLNADYVPHTYWLAKKYKVALFLGFNPQALANADSLFKELDKDTKRVIYWQGLDAEAFYVSPFWQVKMIVEDLKERVNYHFCRDERTKKILSDMGITAELLEFPYDAEKEGIDLPEKFKVLVLCDKNHEKVIDGVINALPHIEFTKVQPDTYYNMMDYTLSLQFMSNKRLDGNTRNFLIKGRYLITNVDEPYAGYLPLGDDAVAFKNALINKIRELKTISKPNIEARNFYLEKANPQNFADAIFKLIPTNLEVVGA